MSYSANLFGSKKFRKSLRQIKIWTFLGFKPLPMKKLVIFTIFIFWMILNNPVGWTETNLPSASIPSLLSGIRRITITDFCQEPVPFDNPQVKERFEKEMLLILWNRPQVILWIKRSGRYLPIIEKMLKNNGVPEDLKYIAFIESALRPHAGSNKGAMGFWQFLKSTGIKYGLTINDEIDQRRNVYASTASAIRYFKVLKQIFGSWTLAAAAYNMGEEGLKSEILLQNSDDYYHLYLPLETQRFVFRALAVKQIFSNPAKYGFKIMPADIYPPLAFDRIEIKLDTRTPIFLIAKAANTYFKTIKDLNPEIRGYYFSAGEHELLVPEGTGDNFARNFDSIYQKWLADKKSQYYIVQNKDSLYTIAKHFNIPIQILMILNGLTPRQYIHPGDRLLVYPGF